MMAYEPEVFLAGQWAEKVGVRAVSWKVLELFRSAPCDKARQQLSPSPGRRTPQPGLVVSEIIFLKLFHPPIIGNRFVLCTTYASAKKVYRLS
jgi:hypothetical protein